MERNPELIMEKKKGSLLEHCVKSIFENLGFKTVTNAYIGGFEVDVYAQDKGIKIITQCKQYEKAEEGRDTLADLIIQWSGKRKYLDCDNIIIALWGFDIARRHYKLAEEERILLWDNQDIKNVLESSYKRPEETRIETLLKLGITSDEIQKYSRKRANKLRKYFTTIFNRYEFLIETRGESEEREKEEKILENTDHDSVFKDPKRRREDIKLLGYLISKSILSSTYGLFKKLLPEYLARHFSGEKNVKAKSEAEYYLLHILMGEELASCFKNGALVDEQKYRIMYSTFCEDKKFSFLRTIVKNSDLGDYKYGMLEGFQQTFSPDFDPRKFNVDELDERKMYIRLDSNGFTIEESIQKAVEKRRKV